MYRIHIKGIVQGVGFRPYIYRKAKENDSVGYVKNVGDGVEILVDDKDFIDKLTDLPPLARIDEIRQERVDGPLHSAFMIVQSSGSAGSALIPPDIGICRDCQRELWDQGNRRYAYHFVTCTNCGPRFSMITGQPYDRPMTTMHEFAMCAACKDEYANPVDRRFHAQTIACKKCGPKLKLASNGKDHDIDEATAIQRTSELLDAGEIVAIKGIGGFHLSCICEKRPVDRLKKKLGRMDKPLAIMVRDMGEAKKYAHVSKDEEAMLQSIQKPIVILEKREACLEYISELSSIGIMLPYTALHLLLLEKTGKPLVMTSCNVPGQPIIIDKIEAKSHATHVLYHERCIANRCDDSIVKVAMGNVMMMRRSRGYVPLPVRLPHASGSVLALGAEQNNAFAVTLDDRCFLSQHIGNTKDYSTLNYLKMQIRKQLALTGAKPAIVACDLHPGYGTSHLAEELAVELDAKLCRIQHHKAHVAGAAAEHGIDDYAGIAMDGLGYGEDGKIWGGEVFKVKNNCFERIGSLEEMPMLGGDSSIVHPKKMLFGILSMIMAPDTLISMRLFPKQESQLYIRQLEAGFNVPTTTSAGRVLDAAAALLGICDERTYDARPAMLLESHAKEPLDLAPLIEDRARKELSISHLFEFLLKNRTSPKSALAATVQDYLARGMLEIAKGAGNDKIVFAGGVAYNRAILSCMIRNGVLLNKELPPGDGGICYGQAYLANAQY